LAERGWQAIDLPELRPDAAALLLSARWRSGTWSVPGSPSLEFPALPLEGLLSSLPGRTAKAFRYQLRKIDAAAVQTAVVPPDEVSGALQELLALHEEQWRGRDINPEHLRPRFRAHLAEAVPRMVGAGQAVLVRHLLDGAVVAVQLHVLGHCFLGYYLGGVSPALRRRLEVTPLLVRSDVELTRALGLARYSMLRGREEFKLRWRPEEVRHQRLLLSHPGPFGGLGYPSAVRARAAAVAVARTRAPWLKTVRDQLKRARLQGIVP
jgi:hypothetical protein